ncbi:MAG: RluA family pseudouridine synthase [Terrimicrobiaceae bacterium]
MNSEPLIVAVGSAGIRLDRFLSLEFPDFSRVRLQTFVRDGFVLVNGATTRPSQALRLNDRVEVTIPAEVEPATVSAQDIPLNIIYEDKSLLVLNKPAGLVVHPGAGNSDGTLVNALLFHCAGLSVIGGVERPGIVHRLDKETSGCLAVAKTDIAHRSLSEQFANRTVKKTYLALVEGVPRMPHGKIDATIGRHAIHRQKMAVNERGRDALTQYRVLASSAGKALLECQPRTGRTHQIRVHLKHLGHAIVGDPLYGRRGEYPRHFLHAWKISFAHPKSGKALEFCAPLPPDFPAWAVEASLISRKV